jgi:DnaJ domain
MDPYRILGLSRKCTREAVKAAFRARVWRAHPDRGGDAETFIQICTAYKQILEELERRPRSAASNPPQTFTPRPARPAAPPDPFGDLEIILFDEPPDWNRPPTPPDPNWEPEMVLVDEAPPISRRPEPLSPKAARRSYVSWLRQVAATTQARRSIRRSSWFRTLGIVMLLGLLGGNLWLCWIAWTYDPNEAARDAELEARAAAAERPAGGPRSGP